MLNGFWQNDVHLVETDPHGWRVRLAAGEHLRDFVLFMRHVSPHYGGGGGKR